MTIKQKNIYYGIGFILLAIILIAGVRFYQINKIDSLIEAGRLSSGLLEEPISLNGEKYLIPPTDLFETGMDMPAINEPKFTTVSDADSYLADNVSGIDVEVNGEHRFYSYQILNWHEVVNDSFGGKNLAITHCTLCKSSAVYETELDFENSGLVYNNNELLKDTETASLWSQIRGVAVSGDKIGEQLNGYGFSIMNWGNWKEEYPNGEVLSSDTGYSRDYTTHPYAVNYDTAKIVYFPINNHSYQLVDKAPIKGFVINGEPLAVSDIVMALFWSWNGEVGGQGISVFYDIYNDASSVYQTDVEGQRLTFEFDIANNVFIDDQTGSTWNIDGYATDGQLSGTQLTEVTNYRPMFLMCFVGSYGDTVETRMDNSIGGGLLGSNENSKSEDETNSDQEQTNESDT